MNTFLNDPFVERKPGVGILETKILRTLLYFDIFHHPLRSEEIWEYLQFADGEEKQFNSALQSLLKQQYIYCAENYYAVRKADVLAHRREKGEQNAAGALHTAKKYSKLIGAFPFVRGVCISGSLSKGYMDATTDIDYFIITRQGRLWLSRTLLVIFKKIFLLNSRKYFCINYFIASDNLRIPDQNIFTATETAFLIPTYNYPVYRNLLNANPWVKKYFPNYRAKPENWCNPENRGRWKRIVEKLFSGALGEKLDAFCFRITLKFWKKKFKNFDASTFDHRLRSRKNVSKHHPRGFQERVLTAYEKQIQKFGDQHSLSLDRHA